ncbi:uncharacterized protein LOC121404527 [Drosophila obscura]|uniref:uncharacterized protein LOC121404527 n=1 Tax=Drosophila obscura TaxID=7282 RepID=UPI001BB23C0F|nr:uncharacterized protein LOC121404527 [Drosophila obscura]
MAKRIRYKLSDLTDEQLLDLFESVPSDEEVSDISSDDGDDDLNLEEALTNALEDDETVSFIDSNVENVQNVVQEPGPSRKTTKRPRSPLPITDDSANISSPSSGGFNGFGIESITKEPSKIVWRQQCLQLHANDIFFRGDSPLPAELMKLRTPSQLFCYFFNSEIMNMITEETMRAALTNNISNKFKINSNDIHRYIGILMYMSIIAIQI